MADRPETTDDPRVHHAWSTLDDAGRSIKLRHHLSLAYPVPAAWVAWLLQQYESLQDRTNASGKGVFDDQSETTSLATYSDVIAAEIAADAAHYLLTMYPHATPEKSPSMLRSLRAHIAMDVAATMQISTSAEARAWIDRRQRHRREINRLRKLGDQAEVVRGDAAAVDVLIDQMMAPQEIDHA
jgi:hypothetical protein